MSRWMTLVMAAAAVCATGESMAENYVETPQMEIGANFWDIAWGGPKNQPFKTPFDAFEASENPWNPEFLEELKIYTSFRFMDWIKTNSPERDWERGNDYHRHGWEGRTKPDDRVQKPVAWEWMIDLCNRLQKDLWITVPHVVDDDYVRNLAELIKTRLDPNLHCWVEWSNETWNGMFTQAQYCNRKGQELPDEMLEGFKYSKENEWYTGQVYHALRTLQVHGIFLDVFGDQRDRLILVMGGSMAHAFYRESHLFAIKNPKLNPKGIVPDAYALAPYIGHGVLPDDPEAFEKLGGPVLEEKMEGVAKIATFMKENGIETVAYEGGQHIKHTLDGAVAFQKRPEMYDLYMKYLEALSKHLTYFSHYTHTGGSWGAKEFIGEPIEQAPKYRALKDWAARE